MTPEQAKTARPGTVERSAAEFLRTGKADSWGRALEMAKRLHATPETKTKPEPPPRPEIPL